METNQGLQKIIEEFERFYFRETLKRRIGKDSSSVTFQDYIEKPEQAAVREKLERDMNSYDNLEQLIFNNLTDKQKTRIGGLFHIETREFYGGNRIIEKADIIDRHIANTEEYGGFIDVKDFLTSEEKERLAERLAAKLYEKLDEETKQLIEEKSIKRYLLNIGFIKTKRPTHRNALNFIKKYPAFFKSEQHVIDSILERYIDDELTHALPNDTSQKIESLREEVREMYRSVLE